MPQWDGTLHRYRVRSAHRAVLIGAYRFVREVRGNLDDAPNQAAATRRASVGPAVARQAFTAVRKARQKRTSATVVKTHVGHGRSAHGAVPIGTRPPAVALVPRECVCVYVHVCVCVCLCVRVHVCVHVRVYVHLPVLVYVHVCARPRDCERTRICVSAVRLRSACTSLQESA